MNSFRIGDLEIPVPIVQGGMGVGISLSNLASAVANNGGVGVIATVGIGLITNKPYKNYRQVNIDALREEIRKARKMSNGIIGVNIMVALTNYADMVNTSIEEGIDVIFSGAGLPLDLPKYLPEGCKTKLVPIVSSGRAAQILATKWKQNFNYLPDAFVLEGPKAGGHLGYKYEQIDDERFQLENLIPDVLKVAKELENQHGKHIPVIVGGGIYTGADIRKFIEMGAEGVQMGTRFVATHECDASTEFKEMYVKARKEDVTIIKSPVGMPGRVIINQFVRDMEAGKQRPVKCRHHCIHTCDFRTTPFCIADALLEAQTGRLENGFAFTGSNVHLVHEIVSVAEVFESLKKEYAESGK